MKSKVLIIWTVVLVFLSILIGVQGYRLGHEHTTQRIQTNEVATSSVSSDRPSSSDNSELIQLQNDQAQQHKDDVLLTSRAKMFMTLVLEYHKDAQQQHDQLQRISKKAIADELVTVPVGGKTQTNFTWGTIWYQKDVQIQSGSGTSRTVTVHGKYEATGLDKGTDTKSEVIYYLQFKDGKIDHYHAFIYDQPQSGVVQ